ncbi:MAG TPA: proton-conducting transporter membrane subunit [Opitutaceae bacterium]|nr:proton-conducting transporter membrane subunit [Opitutaceae bacterium]
MTPVTSTLALLLLPLASAAVIALFLRRRHNLAAAISVLAAAGIAALAACLIFGPENRGQTITGSLDWLTLGPLTLKLGFLVDDLAKLMLSVVAFVGFLIHVFSLGYMHDDAAKARFFGGLSVFMFSMLGIVLADNLFMIFVFWELVGFSSYLLINHYNQRQSAADASKKAFIVNRVGDFGFLLGIIWCFWLFGTTNLTELTAIMGKGGVVVATALPLLLFCGAVGKSAQFPLQVWLPDAMEGPTPVSALIHAATMVAAGIYMLCRINVLMTADALSVILWIGVATAAYAALCAVVQRDIKKVLAYSTLSQLGYMVAAFGLGAIMEQMDGRVLVADPDGINVHPENAHLLLEYTGAAAAMFHLTTHAFFKALLFLGSGSVIAGCHHEQDIFKMGGLWKKMPVTFGTFTIGVAAIAGLPFLSGFFSKDAILYLAFMNNKAVFGILTATAVLTSFYMIRMWKITFFGEARSHESEHAHETGLTMTLPLIVLALLSVVGGYSGFFSKIAGSFAEAILEAHGSAHTGMLLLSLGIVLLGGGVAWVFYKAEPTDSLAAKSPAAYGLLVKLQELFDRLYGYYVTKVQQRFALVLDFFDFIFVAGMPRFAAQITSWFGSGARLLHVGSLHGYVYWFLFGAALCWAIATGLL